MPRPLPDGDVTVTVEGIGDIHGTEPAPDLFYGTASGGTELVMVLADGWNIQDVSAAYVDRGTSVCQPRPAATPPCEFDDVPAGGANGDRDG